MSTSSPNSRFAKFLSQFDFVGELPLNRYGGQAVDVRWHGNVGYVELGQNVARIELSDRGYQGHFNKFEVQIINRVDGKVDSVTFEFNDYFTKQDRIDTRSDLPDEKFHAWGRDGKSPVDWYIAVPRSVKSLVAAVNEYLRLWVRF